jgi:hypothetical protein
VSPVAAEFEVVLVEAPLDAVVEPPPHPELRTARDPRATTLTIRDPLRRR